MLVRVHLECVSYKLALVMGTCHLPLQELSHAAAAADLQNPLKGVQGGDWGGGCGTARTGL